MLVGTGSSEWKCKERTNKQRTSHSSHYGAKHCAKWSLRLTHMHTHTHICTCTCIYHSQNWLCGPHSGGEPAGGNKTGGPVGSGDISLISAAAWPPQCIGVLIYGVARPMRRGRWSTALSDDIRITVLITTTQCKLWIVPICFCVH